MKQYQKRTNLQNKSLHLGCELTAEMLNSSGFDQKVVMSKLPKVLDTTWRMESVKNLYKIILKAMYGYDSSTKCDSKQISDAWDKLQDILVGICGPDIRIEFPNVEQTEAYLKSFKKLW